MPKSNSPASGKVKISEWGIVAVHDDGFTWLVSVHDTEYDAQQNRNWATEHVVRLTGTVSYTLAK